MYYGCFRELVETFCSGNVIKNVLDSLEVKLKDRIAAAKAEVTAKAEKLEKVLKGTVLETILEYKKDSLKLKAELKERITEKLKEAALDDQTDSERLKEAIENLLKVIMVKKARDDKPREALAL